MLHTLALQFLSSRLDVRYDGNFSTADGTVNFIKDFNISTRPPKLVASVGFRL